LKSVTAFCLSLFLFSLGAVPAGAAPSLVYLTRLGGSVQDVAVDSAGNAIVLGYSDSSYFVAKLSPSGELIFERPLELPPRAPAAPPREPSAIAIDPAGFIYIAGVANYGYICCDQGTDEANAGFVTKLGPDGTGLIYDTIFLEGANTQAHDLAVDALGQAHVHFTSSWPDLYGVLISAGISFSPAGSVQGYFGYSPNAPYSYVNAISMGLSGDLFAVGWQYPDSYSYAVYLQRTDASSGAVFETLLDDSGTIELLDVAGGPGGSSAVVGMVGQVVPPGVPEGGGFYIAGFGPEVEEVFSRVLNLGAVVIGDIAMTSSGEIVLAGWSGSSSGAFVLRLDGGTGQVLSSINLGSSGYRRVDAVAVGPGGDAYVIGSGLIGRISENRPPDCSRATASPSVIWPPNGKMIPISLLGVIDPESDPVALKVTGISQDEPGAAFSGIGSSVAQVKAESDGKGDGRVYRIAFQATDPSGVSCAGQVTVCVPHDQGTDKGRCVDSGTLVSPSR
jgi:hypothetical protein